MSRPLPALAVIAAASVVGVWIQAATHGALRPVSTQEPTALIGRTEAISAVATGSQAAPARESKSAVGTVTAAAEPRSALATRDATPGSASPSPASHRLGAAMRVAADPQTGQLTAPEHSGLALTIAEMQDLARQEGEGLVTIHNADGSETLNHEGRFTDFTVIRVGPDGRRMFQCVHGKVGLEHALRPAAPATPNVEDR